jgi:hypothetical protein
LHTIRYVCIRYSCFCLQYSIGCIHTVLVGYNIIGIGWRKSSNYAVIIGFKKYILNSDLSISSIQYINRGIGIVVPMVWTEWCKLNLKLLSCNRFSLRPSIHIQENCKTTYLLIWRDNYIFHFNQWLQFFVLLLYIHVQCKAFIVHCIIQCTSIIVHLTVQCTAIIVHCTVQWTTIIFTVLYNVQQLLYNLLYSVHQLLYTVQDTLMAIISRIAQLSQYKLYFIHSHAIIQTVGIFISPVLWYNHWPLLVRWKYLGPRSISEDSVLKEISTEEKY